MGKLYHKQKQHQQKLVEKVMHRYFKASNKVFSDSQALSHRLMAITVGFSRRFRVPLSTEMKRQHCRKCHALLVPGKNCRVRMKYPNIVSTCMTCGHYNKYGYAAEKK